MLYNSVTRLYFRKYIFRPRYVHSSTPLIKGKLCEIGRLLSHQILSSSRTILHCTDTGGRSEVRSEVRSKSPSEVQLLHSPLLQSSQLQASSREVVPTLPAIQLDIWIDRYCWIVDFCWILSIILLDPFNNFVESFQ